jgi:putative membrane protein
MKAIIYFLINGLAVFITALLLPGIALKGYLTAVLVAAVLAVLNTIIRPILVILTLPINILTLGLFTFVINALIVMLVSAIVPGFLVANFWWALLFSLIVSIVNAVLQRVAK